MFESIQAAFLPDPTAEGCLLPPAYCLLIADGCLLTPAFHLDFAF